MRPELQDALAAVDVALGLIARRVGADQISSKGGRDLATGTDLAVEDAVRGELRRRQPDWPIVGEERGGEPGVAADRPYWLVDPICGTSNFASGLPMYTVNIALVEDGRATLAAVGDGATGDRYVAERGRGARLLVGSDERSLRVSDGSTTICLDVGMAEAGPHTLRAAEFARAAIASNRWFIRMLGSTLAYAHVAAGRISAQVTFSLSSPLHTAAGCLLVEEAGGLVTDHDGRPWGLTSRNLLAAATPELQHDLLSMVRSAGDAG